MSKVILFDIDGTLLSAGGASRRAIQQALTETYGTAGPIETWPFGGKTDPQICRELLQEAGVEPQVVMARLPDCLQRYLSNLGPELADASCELMPGLPELLDRLQQEPQVTLGLLTGNLAEGARLKLACFDLNPYFRLGVYGSDCADRYQLPTLALQRASEMGLYVSGKDMVVIGDTPHDIQCGRSIGVRAIAVATGRHNLQELARWQPDVLLPDLGDTERAIAAIMAG